MYAIAYLGKVVPYDDWQCERRTQQLSVRSGVESKRGQADGQTAGTVSPAAGLGITAASADVNHQARRHVIGCPRCGDVTGLLIRSAFCC